MAKIGDFEGFCEWLFTNGYFRIFLGKIIGGDKKMWLRKKSYYTGMCSEVFAIWNWKTFGIFFMEKKSGRIKILKRFLCKIFC